VTSKQNLTHHFKVVRERGSSSRDTKAGRNSSPLRRDLIDDMFPGMLDGLLNAVAASEKNS
jgi:hypothetical protein